MIEMKRSCIFRCFDWLIFVIVLSAAGTLHIFGEAMIAYIYLSYIVHVFTIKLLILIISNINTV